MVDLKLRISQDSPETDGVTETAFQKTLDQSATTRYVPK